MRTTIIRSLLLAAALLAVSAASSGAEARGPSGTEGREGTS